MVAGGAAAQAAMAVAGWRGRRVKSRVPLQEPWHPGCGALRGQAASPFSLIPSPASEEERDRGSPKLAWPGTPKGRHGEVPEYLVGHTPVVRQIEFI